MHFFLETTHWASPNTQIVKLLLLPSTSGEKVMRIERCLSVRLTRDCARRRHVEQPSRQQTSISDLGTMDRDMKHRGQGNGHDCLNVPFSNGVVMMCSRAGKSDHLLEFGKLQGELVLGGKCCTIVSQKGLHDDPQGQMNLVKRSFLWSQTTLLLFPHGGLCFCIPN